MPASAAHCSPASWTAFSTICWRMISPAERAAPMRKSWAAGKAASSSARARASVLASGNILRPNTVPARAISAFHCALRRDAASRQVTIWRSIGVAPVPVAAWRVANSTMRAGEAPAEGEPVAGHQGPDIGRSLRSSAEMWPSSSAWKTHWRA